MAFHDRQDAGGQLGELLRSAELTEPVVLAIPRGGVPVAARVAEAINGVLEVVVARKIGFPGDPEFGIAAIAEGSDEVTMTAVGRRLGLPDDVLSSLVDQERAELDRRVICYRGNRPLPRCAGPDVVLVDDGLATGITAEATLRALRRKDPGRLVLAAPVCAPGTARRLAPLADRVVCVVMPSAMTSIGAWYDDFAQITDAEVVALLAADRHDAR